MSENIVGSFLWAAEQMDQGHMVRRCDGLDRRYGLCPEDERATDWVVAAKPDDVPQELYDRVCERDYSDELDEQEVHDFLWAAKQMYCGHRVQRSLWTRKSYAHKRVDRYATDWEITIPHAPPTLGEIARLDDYQKRLDDAKGDLGKTIQLAQEFLAEPRLQ